MKKATRATGLAGHGVFNTVSHVQNEKRGNDTVMVAPQYAVAGLIPAYALEVVVALPYLLMVGLHRLAIVGTLHFLLLALHANAVRVVHGHDASVCKTATTSVASGLCEKLVSHSFLSVVRGCISHRIEERANALPLGIYIICHFQKNFNVSNKNS